jgi:hypothetical protein
MSYLPSESIANKMELQNRNSFPSSRGSSACQWYTVGGKISDNNLEQWHKHQQAFMLNFQLTLTNPIMLCTL